MATSKDAKGPSMIETFQEFKETKNIDRTTLVSVLEESFRNVIAANDRRLIRRISFETDRWQRVRCWQRCRYSWLFGIGARQQYGNCTG